MILEQRWGECLQVDSRLILLNMKTMFNSALLVDRLKAGSSALPDR